MREQSDRDTDGVKRWATLGSYLQKRKKHIRYNMMFVVNRVRQDVTTPPLVSVHGCFHGGFHGGL